MKFALRVDFIIVKRTSSKQTFLNPWDTSKDVIFVIFRGFSSRLNVTWLPENKGTFRSYDFFLDFKNVIGFCAATYQIVEPELGFVTLDPTPPPLIPCPLDKRKMRISKSLMALELLPS